MPATCSRVNPSDQVFPPTRNYMLLTLRDVLEARHHYHIHLAHLPNVVGTAIGRYLIHKDDWYASNPPDTKPQKPKPRTPRTLFNTVVKRWSWPCVLVFLNAWEHRTSFGKHPDRMVPRALYLPDGRVVPTCTVLVREEPQPSRPDYHLSFANSYLGGGYLMFADVQGEQHLGSVGCLVTDGDLTYALTNRHVTGAEGREMFTRFSGKNRRIGIRDQAPDRAQVLLALYVCEHQVAAAQIAVGERQVVVWGWRAAVPPGRAPCTSISAPVRQVERAGDHAVWMLPDRRKVLPRVQEDELHTATTIA